MFYFLSCLQDDISSLHVFSCTRGLTTAQRRRHLPPEFDNYNTSVQQNHDSTGSTPWFPSLSHSMSSNSTNAIVSYPISTRVVEPSCPRTDSTTSSRNAAVPNSHDRQYSCPPPGPSSTLSSWSNSRSSSWSKAIKTWTSSIRGSAKQQFQTMISDLVGPRLPESLRESLIDAQPCFTHGRILHPPIMRGVER